MSNSRSTKPIRICADCRHCQHRCEFLLIPTDYCGHPRAVDVVTGRAWRRAHELRAPGSTLCGPRGRLWEPVRVVESASPRPERKMDRIPPAVFKWSQKTVVGE